MTGSLASSQIPAGLIVEDKLAVSNAPVDGQVLSWNGTAFEWVVNAGTGGGGASAFSQLTGQITDSQLPSFVARTPQLDDFESVADFAAADAKSDTDGKFYYWQTTGAPLVFVEVNDKAAAQSKADDDDNFYFWTEEDT